MVGLTVIHHPDLDRVGERALPDVSGRWQLSRNAPDFSPPGQTRPRPLSDSCISRQPLSIRPGRAPGSLQLDPRRTPTSVELDGVRLTGPIEISTSMIERGAVVMLGNGIVLLLHRLDPIAQPRLPRFGLVGESPAMMRACRDIARVADIDIPVLIRGETGTGKELIARAIHQTSARSEGPYVAINMAAIPPSLATSELFGAARGAFTGAHRSRAGYFQRADGGTLFLDEIGEMPADVQVLLLRALETDEIQPVGADHSVGVDVRLISATDADLEAAIAEKRYRAPVLHRLSGYVIQLPALRERREDFGRLFVHFLRLEAENLQQARRLEPGQLPWVPAPLVARLARWHWPGNVRQLRNVVRQLVIAHRDMDQMAMLPAIASMLESDPVSTRSGTPEPHALDATRQSAPPRTRTPRDVVEDEMVAALRAHDWRLDATAKALGISRPALYARIAKSDRVRTAADLTLEEIAASLERHDGDTRATARALEVSENALRRRMAKLGLPLP